MNFYTNAKKAKYLSFLYEGPGKNFTGYSNRCLMHRISKLKQTNLMKSLNFERRSELISMIDSAQILFRVVSDRDLSGFLEQKLSTKKVFLQYISPLKNITLKSMSKNFEATFQFAYSMAEGTMKEIVNDLKVQYKKAYDKFLSELALLSKESVLDKKDDLYEYFERAMIEMNEEDVQKLGSILFDFTEEVCMVNDLRAIWFTENKVTDNIAILVGDNHRENIAHHLKRLGYTCENVHNVDPESFERTFDVMNQEDQCENLIDPEVITKMIAGMLSEKK